MFKTLGRNLFIENNYFSILTFLAVNMHLQIQCECETVPNNFPKKSSVVLPL